MIQKLNIKTARIIVLAEEEIIKVLFNIFSRNSIEQTLVFFRSIEHEFYRTYFTPESFVLLVQIQWLLTQLVLHCFLEEVEFFFRNVLDCLSELDEELVDRLLNSLRTFILVLCQEPHTHTVPDMRLIRLHVLEVVDRHQLLLQWHFEEEVDQVIAETCFDVALFEAVLVVGEEGVGFVLRVGDDLLVYCGLSWLQLEWLNGRKLIQFHLLELQNITSSIDYACQFQQCEVTMEEPDARASL